MGRFIIWTQSAFDHLEKIYGNGQSATSKKGFALPRPIISNADIGRTINSDEVQSVVHAAHPQKKRFTRKVNPLTNYDQMVKLNPYAVTAKRKRLAEDAKRAKAKASGEKKKKAPKKKAKKEDASKKQQKAKQSYATLLRKLD